MLPQYGGEQKRSNVNPSCAPDSFTSPRTSHGYFTLALEASSLSQTRRKQRESSVKCDLQIFLYTNLELVQQHLSSRIHFSNVGLVVVDMSTCACAFFVFFVAAKLLVRLGCAPSTSKTPR